MTFHLSERLKYWLVKGGGLRVAFRSGSNEGNGTPTLVTAPPI
jgi:hypothetical protein